MLAWVVELNVLADLCVDVSNCALDNEEQRHSVRILANHQEKANKAEKVNQSESVLYLVPLALLESEGAALKEAVAFSAN